MHHSCTEITDGSSPCYISLEADSICWVLELKPTTVSLSLLANCNLSFPYFNALLSLIIITFIIIFIAMLLFLPRTPFLNHQSSKPESFSCSPVWDLFQRSPLHSFLVIFFFWKPKSSNLKIFRYDWQRQLYIVVFSLYLGFGLDFHDILPVFLPLALIRMWSAFDYDD